KTNTESKVELALTEEKGGKSIKSVVRLKVDAFDYELEPLETTAEKDLAKPLGSGGFLAAMYLYQRFLTMGAKGFEKEFDHGGFEPFYPPPSDGKTPPSLSKLRFPGDTEVINTRHGVYQAKWYLARSDKKLLGFEVRFKHENEEDPCEVYLY